MLILIVASFFVLRIPCGGSTLARWGDLHGQPTKTELNWEGKQQTSQVIGSRDHDLTRGGSQGVLLCLLLDMHIMVMIVLLLLAIIKKSSNTNTAVSEI